MIRKNLSLQCENIILVKPRKVKMEILERYKEELHSEIEIKDEKFTVIKEQPMTAKLRVASLRIALVSGLRVRISLVMN